VSNVRAIARAVFTSLSQGRAILRQIHRLGLEDIGAERADAELDIVPPGNCGLGVLPAEHSGYLGAPDLAWSVTAAEAARLIARLDEPDFMACGFAFIGAWGRRNGSSRT
jgi:hypothetical protein